jgi:hypothetical protein
MNHFDRRHDFAHYLSHRTIDLTRLVLGCSPAAPATAFVKLQIDSAYPNPLLSKTFLICP